jgi:CTP:phosphocholine cytidylyltransferase-like protein
MSNNTTNPVKETLEQVARHYAEVLCDHGHIKSSELDSCENNFISGANYHHPVTLQSVIEVIEGEIKKYGVVGFMWAKKVVASLDNIQKEITALNKNSK